jgi:uncharacterized RDD family membrane protein YckC
VEIILDPIEKLTIDTPEQVHLEYPLAGLGSRFLGVFYDTLVQFIIYAVLFFISLLALPSMSTWTTPSKWLAALLILAGFCVYWGYFAAFEALWNGQTLGKRQAGIRVIKDSGRPITPFEAIARNLVRVVDAFPGFYAVGAITMIFNKRNRRLGDFVAGTVVVHDRKEDENQVIWSVPADSGSAWDLSSITDNDLQVIEAFLERRLDLPLDVRHATAQRLADLYAARLKLAPEARGSNEDLLEAIAIQFRNSRRFRQLK